MKIFCFIGLLLAILIQLKGLQCLQTEKYKRGKANFSVERKQMGVKEKDISNKDLCKDNGSNLR